MKCPLIFISHSILFVRPLYTNLCKEHLLSVWPRLSSVWLWKHTTTPVWLMFDSCLFDSKFFCSWQIQKALIFMLILTASAIYRWSSGDLWLIRTDSDSKIIRQYKFHSRNLLEILNPILIWTLRDRPVIVPFKWVWFLSKAWIW